MMSSTKFHKKQNAAGALFLAPAVLILLVFLAYPVIMAFITSLTKSDLLTQPQWVGLSNFLSIFTSYDFLNSLKVTARFVILASIPLSVISLALAVVLRKPFRGSQFFKLIIFAPVVLSEAITAVVWKMLLNPYGIVNDYLMHWGFIETYIKWLIDPRYALGGIILFVLWKEMGYFMIIFLTGLQSISDDYYEAATIDGASSWHQFFYITLPLLKPTTLFASIIMLINILNTFTPFYVMTGGGPFNSTKVLSMLIFDTGFKFMLMGKAAAMSVIILLIVAVLSIILFRMGRQDNV
jgi:ABC-type sugar transport system permease subunit